MGLDWLVNVCESETYEGVDYYRGKNTERLLNEYGYNTDVCFGDEEDIEHRFRITDVEIQYIIDILAECKEKLVPSDDYFESIEEQEEEIESATEFLTEILEHNEKKEDKVILYTWY